ncbi:MAG: hypothetical protein QOG67_3293 [Verrucomicrobiota bacterium]|jgi:hypothetical protein
MKGDSLGQLIPVAGVADLGVSRNGLHAPNWNNTL